MSTYYSCKGARGDKVWRQGQTDLRAQLDKVIVASVKAIGQDDNNPLP